LIGLQHLLSNVNELIFRTLLVCLFHAPNFFKLDSRDAAVAREIERKFAAPAIAAEEFDERSDVFFWTELRDSSTL
jgi:hypothetical protein